MKLIITHILLFTLTAIFLSCGVNNDDSPIDIIPENKMIVVISEIEFTKALINFKFSKKDSLINQSKLFNEVYEKYNTSEELFNKSLIFYAKQPKKLESMYAKIRTKLSEKQAEINEN